MSKPHQALRDVRLPEGKYANYLKVGHNQFEFVLEFGQSRGDSDTFQFHSWIIANPVYTKAFVKVLQTAVARYEEAFGTIREPEEAEPEKES